MKGSAIKSVALVLAFGLMTACGGGGDGTTATGIYTGVTTQATVTTSNATDLSIDAYENGGMGASASIAGVVTEEGGASASQPLLQEVGASLRSGVARALQQQPAAGTFLAGVTAQNTIYGAYGGSASLSIDLNQSTGGFTGSITFNNLKENEGGSSISGTVTVSGNYNQNTGEFSSLQITFAPLSATTAGGTYSLYGTISFSLTETTETLRVSCTLHTGGKSYWVKDWTYTLTTGNTLTITGRYYNPIYGYVDVTTATPLTVNSVSGLPSAGVLLFTGLNGTKVRVTFTATGYTVDVDANGNGQYVPVP